MRNDNEYLAMITVTLIVIVLFLLAKLATKPDPCDSPYEFCRTDAGVTADTTSYATRLALCLEEVRYDCRLRDEHK